MVASSIDRPVATRWPVECVALRSYFQHATDAYQVSVSGAFALVNEMTIVGMVDARGTVRAAKPASPIFRPASFDRPVAQAQGAVAGQGLCSVPDIVHRWGFQWRDLEHASVFCCVEPVAQAVLQGRWHSFVWLARWFIPHPIFPGFPPEEWSRSRAGKTDIATYSEITQGQVASLMDNLRRWLPSIMNANADPEDAASERTEVELGLTWLSSLQDHLCPRLQSHISSSNTADDIYIYIYIYMYIYIYT